MVRLSVALGAGSARDAQNHQREDCKQHNGKHLAADVRVHNL